MRDSGIQRRNLTHFVMGLPEIDVRRSREGVDESAGRIPPKSAPLIVNGVRVPS